MNEPTNVDVLDAVTLELGRFTREVVAEMHRLRDELVAERQRTDQLESTVQGLKASLRKYDTQAARIVDHVTKFSAEVDRRFDNVERRADLPVSSFASVTPPASMPSESVPPVSVPPLSVPPLSVPPTAMPGAPSGAGLATGVPAEPEVQLGTLQDGAICFAPLILTLDPVEPEPARDSSIDDLIARVVGAVASPAETQGNA